jgi:hypothetical protein
MKIETTKLTVRVPREHLEAAKEYARQHGVTLTEVIDRYLRSLQSSKIEPSKEVATITGLVPTNIDAATEYRNHMVAKHSQ